MLYDHKSGGIGVKAGHGTDVRKYYTNICSYIIFLYKNR